MRALVATTAGAGHFAALLPFAAALRDAGHAVRVAAPASFASAVRRAGFAHVPLADAPPHELGTVLARLPGLSRENAASAVMVSEVFAGLYARAALPAMRAVVEAWRPDLLLRETAEFASYVAAERGAAVTRRGGAQRSRPRSGLDRRLGTESPRSSTHPRLRRNHQQILPRSA